MKNLSLNPVDWQKTQNEDYLNLVQGRLSQPPLVWCNQFMCIIEKYINEGVVNIVEPVIIKDIGCNVGHFLRVCEMSPFDFEYKGFDISETYLEVARKRFFGGGASFSLLDVSLADAKNKLDHSQVTVVSATLEHIKSYEVALDNIFSTTENLVLIRTFLGDRSEEDYCHTKGAEDSYLIRQFTVDQLTKVPDSMGWKWVEFKDEATQGVGKYVCNGESIFRKQLVYAFYK